MTIDEFAKKVKQSRERYDEDYTAKKESLRLAHVKLYDEFVKVVEALPNPIKEIDVEIEKAESALEKLRTSRAKLVKACKHLAYYDHGGHDYFIEECVQCGERNII